MFKFYQKGNVSVMIVVKENVCIYNSVKEMFAIIVGQRECLHLLQCKGSVVYNAD